MIIYSNITVAIFSIGTPHLEGSLCTHHAEPLEPLLHQLLYRDLVPPVIKKRISVPIEVALRFQSSCKAQFSPNQSLNKKMPYRELYVVPSIWED